MLQLLEQTYNRYWVDPTVHVLLTTDNPTSEHILAWSHKYENSRIVSSNSATARQLTKTRITGRWFYEQFSGSQESPLICPTLPLRRDHIQIFPPGE